MNKVLIIFLACAVLTPATMLVGQNATGQDFQPILLAQKSRKGKGKKSAPKAKKGAKKPAAKKGKALAKKAAEKKKGPRKPGLRFGIAVGGALETLTAKNENRDPDQFNGFSGQGLILAQYPLGSLAVVAGGGIHIASYSSENEAAALKISTTTILLEGGLNYRISPAFGIGGIFRYGILMSGTFSLESLDENVDFASEGKITGYSPIAFGGQAYYNVTPNIRLAVDAMMSSGSITTEPVEEGAEAATVPTSGMLFRGLLAYFF